LPVGLVRIQKERVDKGYLPTGQVRGQDWSEHRKQVGQQGTHLLEKAEVGTGCNIERKKAIKGNSLPGEVRCQDWSGHRKETSQEVALTSWRGKILRLVRAQKERQASEGYPPPGEVRGWN